MHHNSSPLEMQGREGETPYCSGITWSRKPILLIVWKWTFE